MGLLRSMVTVAAAAVTVAAAAAWWAAPSRDRHGRRREQTTQGLSSLLFDIFAYSKNCGPNDHALVVAGEEIFRDNMLLELFGIPSEELRSLLREVIAAMELTSNPYHNSLHVADVVQSVHAIISRTHLQNLLTPEDKLVVLVAAVIHDYEHRGLSNDFLEKSNDSWFVEARERGGGNETHHASAGVALLRRHGTKLFPGSAGVLDSLVPKIVELVLATDMSQHKSVLEEFKSKCHTVEGKMLNRPLIMKLLLKVSDLGHCFGPWEAHHEWAKRLENELWREGDSRRELKLPIDKIMDREQGGATDDQRGFFEHVILPLLKQWTDAFPECIDILTQAKKNCDQWDKVK